jgi:hypothetical protein
VMEWTPPKIGVIITPAIDHFRKGGVQIQS